MNRESMLKEVSALRVSAQVAAESNLRVVKEATRLERLLTEEVSISSKSRPQFQKELAVILAKREKRYQKK